MSNPDTLVLHPEELATRELRLDGPGVWRLAAIVTLPLAIALVVEHVGVAVLCWSVLALLFVPLVRGWGHTSLAVMTAVVPVYVYLELDQPPVWLAFVAGFLSLVQILWLRYRLAQIRLLRAHLAADSRCREREQCGV